MKTQANDPAFAGNEYDHGQFNPGLSKREILAAMAMQGMLSSGFADPFHPSSQTVFVKEAVDYADALIAQLNTTSTEN